MGDYHDLYSKKEVLLLTDVSEELIGVCLEYYGLDPCHYFISPGLSSNTIFKMIEIELELISVIHMYFFVEKGMEGSISHITKRYSKAKA